MDSNLQFWFNVLTIIAIILGPIFAVIVTRSIDNFRYNAQRKLDIYKTLMRTRKMPIHADHVGALNLIEVEFSKNKNVVSAWKAYLGNLGNPMPAAEDKERYEDFLKKRDSLLTKLISDIASALGIKVEQLDILEGNYVPKVWNDDHWDQLLVRKYLINVLSGRASLLVRSDQTVNTGLYPPRPSDNTDAK